MLESDSAWRMVLTTTWHTWLKANSRWNKELFSNFAEVNNSIMSLYCAKRFFKPFLEPLHIRCFFLFFSSSSTLHFLESKQHWTSVESEEILQKHIKHYLESMMLMLYHSWIMHAHLELEVMTWDCKRFDLSMVCVNSVLLTGLLTYGIVCLTGLLQLRVLTYLKQDSLHSGIIRTLYDFCAQLVGTGSLSEI